MEDLKRRACQAVEAWADRLWDTSLAIHAHPELGYAEVRASALLAGLLESAGLDVERGVGGLLTAFRCIVRGRAERPAVAVLGEMDALPGIGHGCGHNLIGTAAVGAGLALHAVASELPGSALILGCPAEESAVDNAGGKIALVRAGAFTDADAAIMMHPGTEDDVSLSASLAAVGFEFTFKGRAAHAAISPEDGINALDGVLLTFSAINALRQHVRQDVRIHGVITNGGAAPNIVPDRAVCRFRVRSGDRRYLAVVAEKVVNCARAGALASGAELVVREVAPMYEELRPNTVVAGVLRDNLAAVGRVVRSEEQVRGGMGSTDLGNVSQVVPAVSVTVAIADGDVRFHSPEFAAAAASSRARSALLDSAKAMAMTVIDLAAHEDLLADARAEFEAKLP